MKTYVCSVTIYDLLLELRWQKRVQMKIDMSKRIMSIVEIDEKKRMIHTQLTSKKILIQMSIVEIKDEEDFDEEKALQVIIEKEEEKLKDQR
jgi:hypothetical protein